MYDRAPRKLLDTKGCTAEAVGPGTYDADVHSRVRYRGDGYAPFLSMTSRETFLNQGDQVIAAPGPGQYDPVDPQFTVKGGRTLQNKSNRFFDQKTFTPGPGAYNLKSRWINDNGGLSSTMQASASSSPLSKKPSVSSSKVKLYRKPDAPSIPAPGQSYGYEENDDGTLKKQGGPARDRSLGPAFYNPAETVSRPTAHYKGNFFGNKTSGRTDFGGKRGPGPGDYEPYETEAKVPLENANLKEEERKRFEARLPRYHELVVKQEEKKAVPGPGKYEVKGQFDDEDPKINTEGVEVEHPPFGSQAKRFVPDKTITPSPGSYNDPRHAFESLRRTTGLKRSPFSQTAVRFQPLHHIRKTPGPGSYNTPGLGSDSMRRAYIESTRRGVFGTTSVRIVPMAHKDAVELPGPSHYQVSEEVNRAQYPTLSANFASLSSRLVEQPRIIKEVPPPGAYEVPQSHHKTQDKKDPGKPRTAGAAQKQGAFKSSSSRFAPPRDVIIECPDHENPGPGTYEYGSQLNTKGGLMVTKDNRFKEFSKEEQPGPGAYEFSPLVQDTVLKGTFNATLNNPVARRSIDTAMTASATAKHAFLLGV